MSPATRRSASARCSWWAASSPRRATEAIVPIASAATETNSARPRVDTRRRDRPTRWRTPQGPSAGDRPPPSPTRSPGRIGSGVRRRGSLVDARPRPPPHDGVGEGLPEHPEGAGAGRSGGPGRRAHRRLTRGTSRSPRSSQIATRRWSPTIADRGRGGRQVVVEVAALRRQPGQRIDEGQVGRLVSRRLEHDRRGVRAGWTYGRQDDARAAPPDRPSMADRDAAQSRAGSTSAAARKRWRSPRR